jgi:hypothetical protein
MAINELNEPAGRKKPMSGKRRKSSQNWLTFVEKK